MKRVSSRVPFALVDPVRSDGGKALETVTTAVVTRPGNGVAAPLERLTETRWPVEAAPSAGEFGDRFRRVGKRVRDRAITALRTERTSSRQGDAIPGKYCESDRVLRRLVSTENAAKCADCVRSLDAVRVPQFAIESVNGRSWPANRAQRAGRGRESTPFCRTAGGHVSRSIRRDAAVRGSRRAGPLDEATTVASTPAE